MTALSVPDEYPNGRPRTRRQLRVDGYPINFSVVTPAYVDQLSDAQLRQIVQCLVDGGAVWFMSDCGYALAVDARSKGGILALDLLLDHGARPIPVTVADALLASKVLRFSPLVVGLSSLWPGGIGIQTKPHGRLAKLLSRMLHAPDGPVVRVSQSVIERQISAAAGLPITSAALRDASGELITDRDQALETAIRLHEERTPETRTLFIRETRRRSPMLCEHSAMFSVDD